MDRIVHFETPANDIARAKGFYGSIFGWEIEDVEGMDYTIVRTVRSTIIRCRPSRARSTAG